MVPRVRSLFQRRYAPVWLVLVPGLAVSGMLGWVLYRDALKLDQRRFESEASQISQMLEQAMERYEERLCRLADYCGQFQEVPTGIWNFRRDEMTEVDGNLPAVIHALYCPKILASDFEAHLERGRANWGEEYRFNPERRSGRETALPVWQYWLRKGFRPIERGTDMAEQTQWHPSLLESIAPGLGWVSPLPASVARKDGTMEKGFWFAVNIYKPDQEETRPFLPGETDEEFARRYNKFRSSAATGTLAVFISGDKLFEDYNSAPSTRLLLGRLHAAREPAPAALLNALPEFPANPRHRHVIVMRWYGRRWALELASTPLFESESSRDRGWLIAGGGGGMTLLASALVAVGLRARTRQERMTEQIREARDALAAAQREREKLSHDLHDNAIQALYAIQLRLGHAAREFEAEPANTRREFEELRADLDTVIAEVRSFILSENGESQAVDLGGVLRAMAQRAQAGARARIDVHCENGASGRLSAEVAVQLANIAREAVSNSLRHGEPGWVRIALLSEDEGVWLEVADDGTGFEPKAPARQGVGLRSMAKRARQIGAVLDIQSAPGRGSRVRVRVPVSAVQPRTDPARQSRNQS
jgi:signal transduction histidine kinase